MADDAQGDELLAHVARLGHDLQERAVRVADAEGLEQIGIREATLGEVLLGVLPLAEGPVVVVDDAQERRAAPAVAARLEGRSLVAVSVPS